MKKYSGNKKAFIYGIFSDTEKKEATEVLERLEKEKHAVCCEKKGAMKKAPLFIAFISENIISDEKKMREISFAFENGKKILLVFLDDAELSPGLSMMFGSTQGIFKSRLSEDDFYDRLLSSPLLKETEISEEQKKDARKKTIGLLVLLAAMIASAVVAFTGGVFDTVAPDSLLGKLGISGRVDAVKEIYLYGEELLDGFRSCYVQNNQNGNTESRFVLVNRNRYALGKISDIGDFAVLRNLEALSLAGNEVTDISPLYGLKKLKSLDLTGNSGVSLEGISQMESLEALNISHTDISDFSELTKAEKLKTVYVSADDFDTVSGLEGRKFEVVCTDTVVKSFDELKKATEDDSVVSIFIADTVIIPKGETITIGKNTYLGGHGANSDDPNDPEIYFECNGTVIIEGFFEMGLCTRTFNGAVIVKDGGIYSGGMCDTVINGSLLIERGGLLEIERAHYIRVYNGRLENNGRIVFTCAGGLTLRGGDFVNNGDIYFNCIGYGGLSFENTQIVNNGKCYYYQNGMDGFRNPVYGECTLDFLVEKSFE